MYSWKCGFKRRDFCLRLWKQLSQLKLKLMHLIDTWTHISSSMKEIRNEMKKINKYCVCFEEKNKKWRKKDSHADTITKRYNNTIIHMGYIFFVLSFLAFRQINWSIINTKKLS